MTHLPAPLSSRPFSVAEAESLGLSRHTLRRRSLAAPYRGIRVPIAPPDEEATELDAVHNACAAYVPRLRAGERFWGPTSAILWGCPLPHRLVDEKIHTAIRPPLNSTRESHVVGHQSRLGAHLPPSFRHGLPVADPLTTWLTLAARLWVHDLVAVADYLAYEPPPSHPVPGRPFVTREDFASGVSRFHGRGKIRASEALPFISTRAESRPETLLRLLLVDAGMPSPEVNPEIEDARGEVIGRADLVFRQQRVIVEYDGDQHRTDTKQYEKDMTRLQRFHLAQWSVLRVRQNGLFIDPASTVRSVASALAR
ncbi:DUF559 domain-containing protein [Subtercola sp. PAMC28395]|uniref:endonuclease domain-containing protein n=1 Tax=Subtercola sp. PAMC28395 TaxID=2846775 RepID=UPI001C0C8F99|nr:DUF559 domain-containing protein [Subtercola sp. PAMC28395]QWT23276.1 DUF559 domain-containing protein [Subtercola sp. PAMC28395]